MTRRFQFRTGAPRAVASICWALGCGALLGALACQSNADPKVQSEPARPASSPAAAAPSAAPAAANPSVAAPSVAAPTAEAPSGHVGLAKYEEPMASKAVAAKAGSEPHPAAANAPVPAADAPAGKAAGEPVKGAVVSDEGFSTWLQATSPVTAGGPATVEAVLVAKTGYHCNAEYPHKFKLGAAPAGLTYPEATVKGMQVTPERSVLRIPVVAQSPGKATVAGTLQFSVCNDERCLVEKRELSLNLDVK
ncbi:MAG TPA: hypothetical protein VMG12_18535 [Polyangiaceae bacterium]|nr:hypothetical protein [Polyangiaceae bacterium]